MDATKVKVTVSAASLKRGVEECRATFEAIDLIDRASARVSDPRVLDSLRRARRSLETKARAFVGWMEILADVEMRVAERMAARETSGEEWIQHTAETCPGRPCGDCCDHRERIR